MVFGLSGYYQFTPVPIKKEVPKKKTLSLILALLLCIGLMPSALAADAPFKDVPSSHWTRKEIMEAYRDGAVQGTLANVYNPNGNVTMAQFIAILTRAFLTEDVECSKAAGAWYAANYEAAEFYDLFDGVDKAPDTEVTREVMAQIVYNLMANYMTCSKVTGELTEQDRIPDFGSVSASMEDAVETCYALGLITGIDSAGSFSPKGRMNRVQTAVIYVRLKQVMETGTGIAPAQTGISSETLTNGQPVTEENVLALMEEYKNRTRLPGEKAQKANFTSYVNEAMDDAYDPGYSLSPFGSGTKCAYLHSGMICLWICL